MLSIIPFLSKHTKYASLASQHLARWLRSGAIGVPSEEIFGAGGDASFDKPKRPILGYGELVRGARRRSVGDLLNIILSSWCLWETYSLIVFCRKVNRLSSYAIIQACSIST